MATSTESRIQEDCRVCGNKFFEEINRNIAGNRVCKECKRNESRSRGKSTKAQEGLNNPCKDANLSSKLFPDPEKFQRRKISSSPIGSQTRISVSKKPLRCPHSECAKFVGVFDVSAHFRYEHKEVPHILTHFDARNALEFSAKDVKRGGVRTMLLLNLDDSSTCDNNTAVNPNLSNCPTKENRTFLVLATKLAEYDVEEKLRDKCRRRKTDEPRDTDKWIFWLGSNISTSFSYTLAISTLDNGTRLKYFGPINHLEEDPIAIWGNGKCLQLSRFQIERMSENFHKNLNLDIIIYSDE